MSAAELPLECLQLIIENIALSNDTPSLANLLRTSKRFCVATLPYLYANPFQPALFESRQSPALFGSRQRSSTGDDDLTMSAMKLVKLLLRFAEKDNVTDLMKIAYGDSLDAKGDGAEYENGVDQDKEESWVSKSSGIDYLQYLRHFHFLESNSMSSSHFIFFRNKYLQNNKALAGYLEHSGLATKYRGQELDLEFNPYRPQKELFQQYLSMDLRVQLTWALCHPVLEQVQSLVIPLSDILRYHGVIHRLKNLVDVTFKLDAKLQYQTYIQRHLEEDYPKIYDARLAKRTDALEWMIQFVRDHTRLFPHQLLSAQCPDNYTWSSSPQTCPEPYQIRMHEYLPPLARPQVLDRKNWSQFLAKFDSTDLSQVEVIQAPCDDPDRWFGPLWSRQSNFLNRCRRLKVLEMVSSGSTCFRWASLEAEEQRKRSLQLDHPYSQELSTLMASTSISSESSSHSLLASPLPLVRELVPLEHLRLWFHRAPLGKEELEDILSGFSETLVSISLQRYGHSTLPTSTFQGFGGLITLGQITTMSALKRMVVKLQSEQPIFGSNFLSSCPLLDYLEIENRVVRYSCGEIQRLGTKSQFEDVQVGSESLLKTIKLQGWPALTFHPASLKNTPHLETLSLGVMCIGSQCYIPPVEDLVESEYTTLQDEEADTKRTPEGIPQSLRTRNYRSKRPYWTWDWYLPSLQKLQLTGEFAWRFQFMMLASCPNLESLVINMATIGDSDMVIDPEEDQRQQSQSLHVPMYSHRRSIQIQDFFPPRNDSRCSNHHRQEQYMVATKLKVFLLYGRWSFSDDSLLFMLQWVMPNLTELSESQCLGYTTKGWLRATNRLPSLQTALSTRIVREDKLREFGLEKYRPDPRLEPVLRIKEEEVDGVLKPTLVFATEAPQAPRIIYSFNSGTRYVKRTLPSS
ncbi:hypothetical protein BGZ58_011243 [Dissophora ornata]|nr:hypothetical protein BGZ58_011243 [Dissophora ornata]